MITNFKTTDPDPTAERYSADLENALLAKAFADSCGLPQAQTKQLLRNWLRGTFNAEAHHLPNMLCGRGELNWEPDGSINHRLIWYTPAGVACPLAQVYQQEDGSWVSLIVAGVRDDLIESLGAAEWGISRLTA